MSLFDKCKTSGGYFGQYRKEGDSYFVRPMFESAPGPQMKYEGQDMICWSINDYLGLCHDPELQKVAMDCIQDVGACSPMGSRMLTGNTVEHIELEKSLAKVCHKEKSLVFNYGYLGILGTMSSLVDAEDHIVIDKESHACIIDGAFLASKRKRFHIFRHNDPEHLDQILKKIRLKSSGGILVVTEGVFGMEGDIAPLKEICDLKDKYNAHLLVDDAHGFGVMGSDGSGVGSLLGVQEKIDLYFGTFAKAFASIGGFVSGNKDVIEYVEFNARTHIFAKALPLIYVRSVQNLLGRIIGETNKKRQAMWEICQLLQRSLKSLGFNLGSTASPITPVYVPMGDENMGRSMVRFLRDRNIFVSPVTYPVVPKGTILFRLIPTAAHTQDDVQKTVQAFKEMSRVFSL